MPLRQTRPDQRHSRITIADESGTLLIQVKRHAARRRAILTAKAMGDSERIRRLAARKVEPDEIAIRLKLRPALVRRVLARSAKRGAPRTRGAGTTLSFATSPETAAELRVIAAERGVSLSQLIDQAVQAALTGIDSRLVRPRPRKGSVKTSRGRQSSGPRRAHEAGPDAARPRRARVAPTTAADAPESVRRLLKSYDLDAIRWNEKNDRHVIVVAILTRGDSAAKRWLWSVLSRSEVRDLVRQYGGAGCAEPDRVLLRKQLRLTTADIPKRAYLGLGSEDLHEREGA